MTDIRAHFDLGVGIARSIDDEREWWILCYFPERPPGETGMCFHHNCRPCALAIEAWIHNGYWTGKMEPELALARARGESE